MTSCSELIPLLHAGLYKRVRRREHVNYALERLIGASPGLLGTQRGQGMTDMHRSVIRNAKSFGVVMGGIHERFCA
jgi:hypothetical protein